MARSKNPKLRCGCKWNGRKWIRCKVAEELYKPFRKSKKMKDREEHDNHFKETNSIKKLN